MTVTITKYLPAELTGSPLQRGGVQSEINEQVFQPDFPMRRILAEMDDLPDDLMAYTDVYFANSLRMLRQLNYNPWVQGPVFIRRGSTDPDNPVQVAGIYTYLASFLKYSDFIEKGGRLFAVTEGSPINGSACDALLWYDGPLQEKILLETLPLGVLSGYTTMYADNIHEMDFAPVTRRFKALTRAANSVAYGPRRGTYFGARHYPWWVDVKMAQAAYEGGAVGCSTAAGAIWESQHPFGTMPHIVEAALAARVGTENAVLEATKLFVETPGMPPCVSLVDYNNREVTDSVRCFEALGKKLFGVRIDTHGGNVGEGAAANANDDNAKKLRTLGFELIPDSDPAAKFWYGPGVTVTNVLSVRLGLNEAGGETVKVFPTSGFGNPVKVRVFEQAERILGIKLFDGFGAGEVTAFKGRFATDDCVIAGEERKTGVDVGKVGRQHSFNQKLKPALGLF